MKFSCIKASKQDDAYAAPAKESSVNDVDTHSINELQFSQKPNVKKYKPEHQFYLPFFKRDLKNLNKLIQKLKQLLNHRHSDGRCSKLVWLNHQYEVLIRKIQWNIARTEPPSLLITQSVAVNIRTLTRKLEQLSMKVERAISTCNVKNCDKVAKKSLYPDLWELQSQFHGLVVTELNQEVHMKKGNYWSGGPAFPTQTLYPDLSLLNVE